MTVPGTCCLREDEGRAPLEFPATGPFSPDSVSTHLLRAEAHDYRVEKARKHAASALQAGKRIDDACLYSTLEGFVDYLFGRMERLPEGKLFSSRPQAGSAPTG